MKRQAISSMIFASLALVACAADAPTGGNDNDNDNDNPGGDQDDVSELTMAGKYELTSKFDIAANMPGTVGQVANEFIAMTDGGADPGEYILQKAVEAMPSGTIRNLVSGAVPFLADYVNGQITQLAPDFIPKMKQIGDTFGDVTKNFGMLSQLDVTRGTGSAYTGVHTVDGVQFEINGQQLPFLFADYSLANIVVNNVGLTFEQSGKITIADHKLPLQYGAVLRVALDEAIIPAVDPTSKNLGEVLGKLVDCDKIGTAIQNEIGFGGASTYAGFCRTGLQLAADQIYTKLAGVDGSALEFQVTGSARGIDASHDDVVDTITTGAWGGTLAYGSTPAPLATAIFSGEKM